MSIDKEIVNVIDRSALSCDVYAIVAEVMAEKTVENNFWENRSELTLTDIALTDHFNRIKKYL